MSDDLRSKLDAFFDSSEFTSLVEEGFKEVDADNSGSVDKSELGQAMRGLKDALAAEGVELPEITQSAIDECMGGFDASGDGKLQKSEFSEFVKAVFNHAFSQMT